MSALTPPPPHWRLALTRWVLLLLPVGTMTVPDWNSALFVVLALLLALPPQPGWGALSRGERAVMWVAVAYFAAFVAAWAASDAGAALFLKRLEVEVRYLLLLPVYLLVRRVPQAERWLLRGCGLAGLALLASGAWEVGVLGRVQARGVYNPIPFGTFSALTAVLALEGAIRRDEERHWRVLLVAGSLAAAVAVVLAGSRAGYLNLLLLTVLWGMLRVRGRQRIMVPLGVAVAAVGLYAGVDRVRQRVDSAIDDVRVYLRLGEKVDAGVPLPDQGVRFEMWRAAVRMWREHPVLGVGPGRWRPAAGNLVSRGEAHPAVRDYNQAHSSYFHFLATRGLVGLAALVALMAVPAGVFIARMREGAPASVPGLILITAYAAHSLTETPFKTGKEVAVYLVYLAVFLAAAHRPGAVPRRAGD